MKKHEKKIFIASTTKHLDAARCIQEKINNRQNDLVRFNAKVWDEGDFFTPGQNGLTSLIAEIKHVDYAIIILTADDEVRVEGKGIKKIPRDNLLFELGLSYGLLGEGKVIALAEKSLKPKELLSDYLGITFVQFDIQDLEANSGSFSAAVTKIANTFSKIEKNNSHTSSYFKEKMINWRRDKEAIKHKEIIEGNWVIWLLKEDFYLRYIFGGVLASLTKGDSYLTVSNLNFWASLGVDVDAFISNNLDALYRGVEVKRVILINDTIFKIHPNDQYYNAAAQTLIKIVDRFKDKRNENKKIFEKMKLHFLVTNDYFSDIGHSPSPFAIIENKSQNDHALITPLIEQPVNQVMITFKPISQRVDRPNNYDSLFQKFNSLFTDKRVMTLNEIDSYLNKYRKNKTT